MYVYVCVCMSERALLPSIPPADEFPYSIRAESLITESCGSSSMATVCACCMAMLDAGTVCSNTYVLNLCNYCMHVCMPVSKYICDFQ